MFQQKKEPQKSKANYNYEQKFTYKGIINRLNEGIRSYFPVEIKKKEHFLVDCYCLGNLVEFQFRRNEKLSLNNQLLRSSHFNLQNSANNIEEYIQLYQMYYKNMQPNQIYHIYIRKLQSQLQKINKFNDKMTSISNAYQSNSDYLNNINNNNMKQSFSVRTSCDLSEFQLESISESLNLNDNIIHNIQHFHSKQFNSIVNQELDQKPINNSQNFLMQVNLISKMLFEKLFCFVNDTLKLKTQQFIKDYLKNKYNYLINQKYKEFCTQSIVNSQNFGIQVYENIGNQHQQHSEIFRKQRYMFIKDIKVMDTRHQNSKYVPIIFLEILLKKQDYCRFLYPNSTKMIDYELFQQSYHVKNNNNNNQHLYFLVHGFQGISFDLLLWKNIMKQYLDVQLYLCCSNELDTEVDLDMQGRNLAREVEEVLGNCSQRKNNDNLRISFIGFSMGGLIIRSAIRYLDNHKHSFYNYVSLSSPHLGCDFNANYLIKQGMKVIETINKSQSLKQMGMRDNLNDKQNLVQQQQDEEQRLQQTFLYKLSLSDSLMHFQNLIIFSSYQDMYVPYESARIEYNLNQIKNRNDSIYKNMADNIFKNNNPQQRLFRFDINFKMQQSNVDTLIGRAAHIEFIENDFYMKLLFSNYAYLFK